MKKPLIVIVGETASGKSSLAMDIANQYNGEIICADSWTVYKDFDIGTAKPNKEERLLVPHHLLDIVNAKQGFSAAEFKKRFDSVYLDIDKRGALPIMVGGTGLYIDSVLYNYGFLPAGPISLRTQLDKLSLDDLLSRIKLEGYSLEGIDTRNKRRLVRLIESGGLRPRKHTIRDNTIIIGIRIPLNELDDRIKMRVDSMFESGLTEEVRQLAGTYGWAVEPMKGIGYREFRRFFENTQSLEETKQQIIQATRQLAKKQRTWFKRNKYIQWVDNPSKAVDIVTTYLNTLQ